MREAHSPSLILAPQLCCSERLPTGRAPTEEETLEAEGDGEEDVEEEEEENQGPRDSAADTDPFPATWDDYFVEPGYYDDSITPTTITTTMRSTEEEGKGETQSPGRVQLHWVRGGRVIHNPPGQMTAAAELEVSYSPQGQGIGGGERAGGVPESPGAGIAGEGELAISQNPLGWGTSGSFPESPGAGAAVGGPGSFPESPGAGAAVGGPFQEGQEFPGEGAWHSLAWS